MDFLHRLNSCQKLPENITNLPDANTQNKTPQHGVNTNKNTRPLTHTHTNVHPHCLSHSHQHPTIKSSCAHHIKTNPLRLHRHFPSLAKLDETSPAKRQTTTAPLGGRCPKATTSSACDDGSPSSSQLISASTKQTSTFPPKIAQLFTNLQRTPNLTR